MIVYGASTLFEKFLSIEIEHLFQIAQQKLNLLVGLLCERIAHFGLKAPNFTQ